MFAKHFQNFIHDTRYLNSLRQGLSKFEFYGDLVYKLKKIVGSDNFSAKLIKGMKLFLYKHKWLFYHGDRYLWLICCMNDLYI